MSKVYIISELCGQWGGDVRRAEQMILQSKMGGADAVKVQLYDTYKMPGENREKWEYLSMSYEQYHRLESYAQKLNIDFFASCFHNEGYGWYYDKARKINKIASSLVRDDPKLCEKQIYCFDKNFVSLGCWDKDEFPFNDPNIIYFHCLAKYPHNIEEALDYMPEKFEGQLLGYSDHSIGIGACQAAIRRGATYIEKHFTTDHSLQSDTEGAHACSMNFEQLKSLRIIADRQK